MSKPLHIGVYAGIGPHAGRYVITAEYLNGYDVLGVYATADEARADLALVRQIHRKRMQRADLLTEEDNANELR